MSKSQITDTIPQMANLARKADYIHILTIDSPKSLREFTAATLSYMPGWMRFLFWIREPFVRLLGETQEDIPTKRHIAPEDVSFTPGDMASFFQVQAGEEDLFWLAEARDEMIAGGYGVIREPLHDGMNRFHLVTTAHYLKRKARLYFAIISPFHLMVINAMARHAQ